MSSKLVLNDDKIVFAGDWHGYLGQGKSVINYAYERGIRTIIHVGDFGIWKSPEEDAFVRSLQFFLEKKGITLYFVDGNHENFDAIYACPIIENGTRRITDNIFHLPRGYVFTWNDINVLAMGGAYSVDKDWRKANVSWWSQESITDKDVEEANANCQGLDIGIMITHDSPSGVSNIITDDPLSQSAAIKMFGGHNIDAANLHRVQLARVYDEVKPTILIHGHYHASFTRPTEHGIVIGLDEGSVGVRGNTAVLTVADIEEAKLYIQ